MARILVIDDDELVLATIRAMLETSGHEVTTTADGEEGVVLQRKNPFDLVITDLFMPKKEGLETIIELKWKYPALKIIAISGSKGAEFVSFLSHALKLSADLALAKPFTEDELMKAVNACLLMKV